MKRYTMDWKDILVRRINIVKMSILSKVTYRDNAISTKIPMALIFNRNRKKIL